MPGGAAASRAFWVGLGGVALVGVGLASWAATREWFSRDDFAFLAWVQLADPWSWREVFLPTGERFWPFYRPLGMDAYYRLCFEVFGLAFLWTSPASLAVGVLVGMLVSPLGHRPEEGGETERVSYNAIGTEGPPREPGPVEGGSS